MRIFLPNSARLQNIEGFIRHFDPVDPDVLEFSMHARWVNVHPAVLAFTASVADLVARNGGRHVGEVAEVRSLPYLVRMGLFDHVLLEHGRAITEHEEAGRFIPLKQLRTTRELSDFIVDIVPLLHAEPNQVEPIRYVISELVRNVLEHASSPGGAFVCAQLYRESGVLSIGVADAGIGVQRSMAHSHQVDTAWDALIKALKPGVTGTTARIGGTDYNAGAGLFFTKCIAAASKSYFVLYSGDALFKLKPLKSGGFPVLHADPLKDHHTKRTGMPTWSGTLVGIDIGLESDMLFAELMKAILAAFQVDVKQRKKAMYKRPRFM